jgi:hypothetical protein
MAGYLTLAEFKARSTMPAAHVDSIEAVASGFTLQQIESVSRLDIDSRLRKRYAVPFSDPYPEAVKIWCARIVTFACWDKLGCDPTDESMVRAEKAHDQALAQIKEAADSTDGLFDLPLRADTTATGISKGGPFGYSEQSPYVWTDVQSATARNEDSNGSGTSG